MPSLDPGYLLSLAVIAATVAGALTVPRFGLRSRAVTVGILVLLVVIAVTASVLIVTAPQVRLGSPGVPPLG